MGKYVVKRIMDDNHPEFFHVIADDENDAILRLIKEDGGGDFEYEVVEVDEFDPEHHELGGSE